jgi:hypothetical protein
VQTDTSGLRGDFLRFQTACYRLAVSRRPRGRLLDQPVSSLDIVGQYTEVLSELDRLAEVEQRLAEGRQANADRIVQLFLYLVAVCGVLQTFVAVWVLDSGSLHSLAFWAGLGGIPIAAAAIYAFAEARKRRR